MQSVEKMYQDSEIYEDYEDEEDSRYGEDFEYDDGEEWHQISGYDDDDYENPDYEYEEE